MRSDPPRDGQPYCRTTHSSLDRSPPPPYLLPWQKNGSQSVSPSVGQIVSGLFAVGCVIIFIRNLIVFELLSKGTRKIAENYFMKSFQKVSSGHSCQFSIFKWPLSMRSIPHPLSPLLSSPLLSSPLPRKSRSGCSVEAAKFVPPRERNGTPYVSSVFPSLFFVTIREALGHYLYHNMAATDGSGERALGHVLKPGAWAFSPLRYRLPKIDPSISVHFIYGENDWMFSTVSANHRIR